MDVPVQWLLFVASKKSGCADQGGLKKMNGEAMHQEVCLAAQVTSRNYLLRHQVTGNSSLKMHPHI